MVREILVIISRRLLLDVSMYGSSMLIVGGFVCDQQCTLGWAEHRTCDCHLVITLQPSLSSHSGLCTALFSPWSGLRPGVQAGAMIP